MTGSLVAWLKTQGFQEALAQLFVSCQVQVRPIRTPETNPRGRYAETLRATWPQIITVQPYMEYMTVMRLEPGWLLIPTITSVLSRSKSPNCLFYSNFCWEFASYRFLLKDGRSIMINYLGRPINTSSMTTYVLRCICSYVWAVALEFFVSFYLYFSAANLPADERCLFLPRE